MLQIGWLYIWLTSLIHDLLVQGPSITDCDERKKGLLSRVVDGLFKAIKLSDETTKYTIKLSMVSRHISYDLALQVEYLASFPFKIWDIFLWLLQVEIYMEKVRFVLLKYLYHVIPCRSASSSYVTSDA